MNTKLMHLTALIATANASEPSRSACVSRLAELPDNFTLPALGAALSDCGGIASRGGDWYLAALMRRAQEEIIHALLPTPGHNVRKIFRRKRNQYKRAS